MHAPISNVFSFLFTTFFLSFSPFFLLLVSDYYLAMGCFSPLGLFPFGSLSLGASPRFLLLSYHGFLPLIYGYLPFL